MYSTLNTWVRRLLGTTALTATVLGGLGCNTTGTTLLLAQRPTSKGVVPAPYYSPDEREEADAPKFEIVLPPPIGPPPVVIPEPPPVVKILEKLEIREDPVTEPEKPVKWHVVRKGEILGRIANRYKVSMAELVRWNGLPNANVIRKGQRLAVSEPPNTVSASSPARPRRKRVKKPIPASGTHTVKRNESWWSIAHSYEGLNSIMLRDINAHKKALHPGDVIYLALGRGNRRSLPELPSRTGAQPIPANGRYTVKRGDTLSGIAKMFSVSLKKLRKDNNLKTDLLVPGLLLVIAKDTPVTPAPRPPSGGRERVDSGKKKVNLPHFVDPSDTLATIAAMYGSRVEWILEENPKIKSDADLKKFKQIQVPVEDSSLGRR